MIIIFDFKPKLSFHSLIILFYYAISTTSFIQQVLNPLLIMDLYLLIIMIYHPRLIF